MQPTTPSSVGNYASPMQSPEVQEWIRRQMMEQAISAQARGAIANSPVLGQTPGAVPIANAQGSDAGMLPPPNQPPVVPTTPAVSPTAPASPPAAIQQPGQFPLTQDTMTQPGEGGVVSPEANAMMSLPDNIKSMMSAGVPSTPEQVAERKSIWTELVEKMKSSPQLPALLTHFGVQMMQPIAPGQTAAGHTGMAIQGSLDYGQALRAQEANLAKTQADTAHTVAQTGTEVQKPALVQAQTGETVAQTGSLQANTKRTAAETQTMNENRKALSTKLGLEIDELVAKKSLTLEQAAKIKQETADAPGETAAKIELMKAHAYYYTHPEMHAKAMESAKAKSVDELAKALVSGGDDSLTELYQKDPQRALAKARVEAQAGQVGQYWKNVHDDAMAADNYQTYSDLYDSLSPSKKKDTGSKEQFIINQSIVNLPPDINARVTARITSSKRNKNSTAPSGKPVQLGPVAPAAGSDGWAIKPIK